MSDGARQGTTPESTVSCRWCGADNQITGQPCQQCHRYTVSLPRWAQFLPRRQRWLTRRRFLPLGILFLLLATVVWFNYPFLPDPIILLFKKPTTNVSSTSSPGQWAVAGRDLQMTRYVADMPNHPLGRILWSRYLGNTTRSAPTVVDGAIYLGGHYKVMAMNGETGQTSWELDTTGPVHSSLAVAGDLIYLSLLDHRIVAIDRLTREIRWQFKTGDPISSYPAVLNGMLYFGSWDGFIYALDALTGNVIWKSETVGDVRSGVALYDGAVYAGDDEGNLYILNARTGQRRHRFQTPGSNTSPPAVSNGLVYFASGGRVYAVDAKAREIPGDLKLKKVWAQLWIWQLPGVPRPPGQKGARWRFSPDSADAGIVSPPAVTADALYAGDTRGVFYARNALDGTKLWRFQAKGGIIASPLVLGDRVYFGTRDGVFYALDRNSGEVIWQISLEAPIEVSPVYADGRVYVRTNDGQLHAID